jgi:hypothetical protein
VIGAGSKILYLIAKGFWRYELKPRLQHNRGATHNPSSTDTLDDREKPFP